MAGLIISGFGLGSFIFNFVATFVANPQDVKAVSIGDQGKYFPEDIANRVPMMFVVLGSCYLVITVIGLLLIKDRKLEEQHESEAFTVKNSLGTVQFFQIFFGTLLSGMAGLYAIASFKTIGLNIGYGDGFLTVVGSLGSFCNGISRLLWGILIDKASYKTTYMSILGLQICVCMTFSMVSEYQYLFLLWVCAFTACLGGHYTVLPPISVRLFGKVNGLRVYAFVIFSMGLASISIYFIQLYVNKLLDFQYLFYILAGSSVCSLVSNVFFSEKLKIHDLIDNEDIKKGLVN